MLGMGGGGVGVPSRAQDSLEGSLPYCWSAFVPSRTRLDEAK